MLLGVASLAKAKTKTASLKGKEKQPKNLVGKRSRLLTRTRGGKP